MGLRACCSGPRGCSQLLAAAAAVQRAGSWRARPGATRAAALETLARRRDKAQPPNSTYHTTPSKPPPPRGADMKNLAICVGVGVALSLAPAPAGVTTKAWNLLAIFTGTIVGIITTPLPLGAVAVLGLGVSMLTKTLTFAEAFSAFANEIP